MRKENIQTDLLIMWQFFLILVNLMLLSVPLQTQAQGIFADSFEGGPIVIREQESFIDISYYQINVFDVAADGRQPAPVQINLFDNYSPDLITSIVEEKANNEIRWIGRTQESSYDNAVLIITDQGIYGNILLDNGNTVSIRPIGNGYHNVQELDSDNFPPELPPIGGEINIKSYKALKALCDANCSFPPDPVIITVLVAYTPAAKNAEGGSSAIESLISLSEDVTNQAFKNSGVNVRIKVVHKHEVNYTESSHGTSLGHLRSQNDSHMNEIHDLRDQFNADIVSLLINDDKACGQGFLLNIGNISNPKSFMFSVVHYDCAEGNLSFPHELGHNLGAMHAPGDSLGTGLCQYSYGHRFDTSGGQKRTVMAYYPGKRIAYFSNPDILYSNVATGIANSRNNASTICHSSPAVSEVYSQLTMPNLVGQTENAAETEILDLGLNVGTKSISSSNSVPQGKVISHAPVANTNVNPNTTVNLVISSGPDNGVPVPNVVGQTQAAATLLLNNAGLNVGNITQQDSTNIPIGNVINQSIAAGQNVNPGTNVSLVISRGTVVPNVYNRPVATAMNLLQSAGLKVKDDSPDRFNDTTVSTGNIFYQSLQAGTRVSSGTIITIYESSGPYMVSSSLSASVSPISGLLSQQITTANSGENSGPWINNVQSKSDNHDSPAFVCNVPGHPNYEPNPLNRGFISAFDFISGANEVTYDNCSSAFYLFEFTLPESFMPSDTLLEVNLDDVGIAFLNDYQISATILNPGCDPDPINQEQDSCYTLQDIGNERIDSLRRPILNWPNKDSFEFDISGRSYGRSPYDNDNPRVLGGGGVNNGIIWKLNGSMNELVFGVVGNASYFDPTGLEFKMTISGTTQP